MFKFLRIHHIGRCLNFCEWSTKLRIYLNFDKLSKMVNCFNLVRIVRKSYPKQKSRHYLQTNDSYCNIRPKLTRFQPPRMCPWYPGYDVLQIGGNMGTNFTVYFSQPSKSLGSAEVASEGVRSMSKYIMNDKKGRRRGTEPRQCTVGIK